MAITGNQIEGAFLAVSPTVDGSSVANRAADVLRLQQAVTVRMSPPIIVTDGGIAGTAVAAGPATTFFRTDRAIQVLGVYVAPGSGATVAQAAAGTPTAQFVVNTIADDGVTTATPYTTDNTAASGWPSPCPANGAVATVSASACPTIAAGSRIRMSVAKPNAGVILGANTMLQLIYREV